jgi:hypothetical protein
MNWEKYESDFFRNGPLKEVSPGVIFDNEEDIINRHEYIECPYCGKSENILTLDIDRSQMLLNYRDGESKALQRVLCICRRHFHIYWIDIDMKGYQVFISRLDTFEECLRIIEKYPLTFDLMPPRFRTQELLLASKI